jgi:hypothetical protein
MSAITTGSSAKITSEHLERLAVVYVRQSTLAQLGLLGGSRKPARAARRRSWLLSTVAGADPTHAWGRPLGESLVQPATVGKAPRRDG